MSTLDTPLQLTTKAHAYLLDLPVEIRSQILYNVFRNTRVSASRFPQWVQNVRIDSCHQISAPKSTVSNILLVNRSLRNEGLKLFYSLTTFHFPWRSANDVYWPMSCVVDVFAQSQAGNRLLDDVRNVPRPSDLVKHVHYGGTDPVVIRSAKSLFPALEVFTLDLGWDHIGADATDFDRAMRIVTKKKDWRSAVGDALEMRFPSLYPVSSLRLTDAVARQVTRSWGGGMKRAVFEVRQDRRYCPEKAFEFKLRWRLGWRFLEFEGFCDIDEWILRVFDPDRESANIYGIEQAELFEEM